MVGLRRRLRRRRGSGRSLRGRNQLKVFHRGDGDSAPEIEAPALKLFVPPRGLVAQHQGPLLVPILAVVVAGPDDVGESGAAELGRVVYRLREGYAPERVLEGAWCELRLPGNGAAGIEGRCRNRVHHAVHPARAPRPQHVQLVRHLGYVVAPRRHLRGYFLRVESTASAGRRKLSYVVRRLGVVYDELGAKKVGPERSKKT